MLNVGPDLPLAQAGPLLRDSILGNLLSNAVKFSPSGGRIELIGFETGGSAHVILRDTGRGIPVDVMEDLAHDRVPTSRPGTDGEPGMGYGLLLAHLILFPLARLVERQGGREEAERQRLVEWLSVQLRDAMPRPKSTLEIRMERIAGQDRGVSPVPAEQDQAA